MLATLTTLAMFVPFDPIHILLWALIIGLLFYGLWYLTTLLPPPAQKPAWVILVILAIIVMIWVLLPYAGSHP